MRKSLQYACFVVVLIIISMFFVHAKADANGTGNNANFSPETVSSSQIPIWLFNGSFAQYSVKSSTQGNFTLNDSISNVNLTSGTYLVLARTPSTNLGGIKMNLDKPSIFPAANKSDLSYINKGSEPPFENHTEVKLYRVFTGIVLGTRIGNYTVDRVTYQSIIVPPNNGTRIFLNGTNFISESSGLILQENVSIHQGSILTKETVLINKTNVPLTSVSRSSPQAFYIYGITGAAIAVAIIVLSYLLVKKRHTKENEAAGNPEQKE